MIDKMLFAMVVDSAERRFGVEPGSAMGRKRSKSADAARTFAMRELRDRGFSLTEIGTAFGRDHTTVIAALKTPEERREKRAKLALARAARDKLGPPAIKEAS